MFENLGYKLQIARENSKLSRNQAAELIGITSTMVGYYETGERLPSLPAIVKLATLYKVSVDYLLECDIESPDALSLDGLNSNQIEALRLTADCFRNLNHCP